MLILGDCTEELPKLPSASVDCVITDPPYPEIDRPYGRMTEAEWFTMMRVVVPECMRIIKPTGSAVFILQSNSERVGRMRTWLWDFMAWVGREWGIVQDAYWWNPSALPSGGIDRRIGLMRPSVKPCVWVGLERCWRNQDNVLWEETQQSIAARSLERRERKTQSCGRRVVQRRMGETALERGGVTPFNLLPFANDNSQDSNGAGTPEDLCNWWCRYICPDGGTVLDPFSGTATVGVAAKKQGCSYIGIEKMPEYHAIAQRRLGRAKNEIPLFG